MNDHRGQDDDAVRVRLNELAELAEACRTAFLRTAAASHWNPADDSPAAATATAVTRLDPAGFTLVSEVIVTYLEIAAGHLAGPQRCTAAVKRCSRRCRSHGLFSNSPGT